MKHIHTIALIIALIVALSWCAPTAAIWHLFVWAIS